MTYSKANALLRDIPHGTHCFVDANIFYYHLVDRALNIPIELITTDLLETAAGLSAQLCLLTNDALTIATMKKLGLTNLATNDDDFDQIGITRSPGKDKEVDHLIVARSL